MKLIEDEDKHGRHASVCHSFPVKVQNNYLVTVRGKRTAHVAMAKSCCSITLNAWLKPLQLLVHFICYSHSSQCFCIPSRLWHESDSCAWTFGMNIHSENNIITAAYTNAKMLLQWAALVKHTNQDRWIYQSGRTKALSNNWVNLWTSL